MLCVALGSLCCGAAGWLLSESEQAVQRVAPLRVALIDVSDSVTRVRGSWASWVREALESEARAALEAGEEFAVVAFGEEVVRWHGPAEPEAFAFDPRWLSGAPTRRAGSDLGAALLAAERLAEGTGRGALVRILGDGTYTGPEPTAQLARVRAELVPVPDAERADPWLCSVEAAPELEPGAPLALRVEWNRDRLDARRALALLVRGLPTGERRFELDPAGGSVARLELGTMGSRDLLLEVSLECDSDPVPENNVSSVRVRARDSLQVELVCAPAQASAAAALAGAWGAADGVGVSVASASRVQAIDPETDLLVTLDLDPRAVDSAAMDPFVARGGGWLAAGGGALLAGLDARDEVSPARLLPCEPDEDDEARDVLLVVDVSGSMDGASFDAVRNAAIALVERLRARDQVFLQLFTDRLGELVSLGAGAAEPGTEGERARLLLAARRPSGPTDLPAVFEQLVEAREARRTRACIVVLTDGRDQRGLPSARGRLEVALERLSESGASVRVLASGPQPDLEFLACFARPELRASVASLGSDLGAALERAANAERWIERPRSPRLPSGAASAAVRELRSTLADAPDLERTLALRARAGDAVLLEDDEGHVLAAARAQGAGACAVLATLPGPAGSPQWLAQAQRWLPWARALARGRAGAPPAPAARWVEGRLELGPFEPAVGTPLRGFLEAPGIAAAELALVPVRRAAFPAGTFVTCDAPQGLPLGARLRLESAGMPQGVLPLPVRWAPEYQRPARTFQALPAPLAPGFGVRQPAWGWGSLGLGLVLLTAGALLGSRSRRVVGS